MKKKLVIFTDAAEPQINGVVNTLKYTKKYLERNNHLDIRMVTPNEFKTIPCPFYPEIRLSLTTKRKIRRIIFEEMPDYIHIATEGPLGYLASRVCNKTNISYTSSYHTKFPEYIALRIPFIPMKLIHWYLRKIHSNAKLTLAPSNSMTRELRQNKICKRVETWGRGVEHFKFPAAIRKNQRDEIHLLYVGRISVEKNIEAFLDLNEDIFPKSIKKIVVGDGPDLAKLQKEYEDKDNIIFKGKKVGEELSKEYQDADVFVFPSKTDTFGIVMLEAMSSGTPVAAYPVTGPKDIIMPYINGSMDESLEVAVQKSLKIPRSKCANSVKNLSWKEITNNFWRLIETADSINH